MDWHTLANPLRLLLCGATLYVCLHQLWLGRSTDSSRKHYVAAALAAVVMVFVGARYLQDIAPDAGMYLLAKRLQYASAFALVPLGLDLVWTITEVDRTKTMRRLQWLGVAVSLTPWAGDLLLGHRVVIAEIAGGAAQYHVTLRPLALPFVLLYVAAALAIAIFVARQRNVNTRHGRRRRRAVMWIGPLLFVTGANDILIAWGVVDSVRLLDVGFMGVVLAASYLLMRYTADIHRDLERGVKERTVELAGALTAARNLIDGVPDTVIVHSGDAIRFVNRAASRSLGCDGDALNGKSLADLVIPADLDALREYVQARDNGAAVSPPYTTRFVRCDGGVFVGEVASHPVVFEGTRATVTIVRDVTERQELQRQLTSADRLASVGTLAAGVAHEINNPLTYVIANIAAVREDLPLLLANPSDELRNELLQMLAEADEGADRVRLIVRDLRAFSRTDDRQVQPLMLGPVIQQSVKLAANEIRHRARLEVDVGDDVPWVSANPGRVAQVIVNLLVNAAQSLDEAPADDHVIRVAARAIDDGFVEISVGDTGPGIAEDAVDRLFDPFFTTKPVGVGTGLGLSICHGIVTSFGGRISVENRPQGGTTARVALPMAETNRGRLPEATPSPIRGRRKRILVVDDEPAVGRALVRCLAPHDAVAVNSGADALDACRRQPFDLILCDVMMPGISGIDVCEQLRAEHPEHADRLVFMTGGAFTQRAIDALAALDNARLEKPVSPARLAELVDALP